MIRSGDNIHDSLALSRNASAVQRFHTMRMIRENTVGQHTFNVLGILFHCIPSTALRWQLLAAAWQHDVPEAESGDVPSPTKRALGGFADFERKVMDDVGMIDMASYLDGVEVRWLKLADSLEGWMKTVEELSMGNTLIIPAANNFRRYVGERLDDLHENSRFDKAKVTDDAAAYNRFRRLVMNTSDLHAQLETHHGL